MMVSMRDRKFSHQRVSRLAICLLSFLFDPEAGGTKFFHNVFKPLKTELLPNNI
jgi:hypothetical protein